MPGGGGGRTPASMIMAGILQQRQAFDDCVKNHDWYGAAWFLSDIAALLPHEAYQQGFTISNPPTMGDRLKITPDLEQACRQWIEQNRLNTFSQIPKYVYQYFEKGRQMKRGY